MSPNFTKKKDKKFYLLLRGKVIDNIEKLANLLGCFAFDHVRNSFAANIAAPSELTREVK
jgi:hypothetical protein